MAFTPTARESIVPSYIVSLYSSSLKSEKSDFVAKFSFITSMSTLMLALACSRERPTLKANHNDSGRNRNIGKSNKHSALLPF